MSTWARIPAFLGGKLHGAHVASEQEAWGDLACRWHVGEDPGTRALMREWKWGAGKTSAFVLKVAAWTVPAGGIVPERVIALLGTLAERSTHTQTPTIGDERDASGTHDRASRNASRARDPLPEIREDQIRDPNQGDPREREASATLPHAAPPAPPPERVPPPAPRRPAAAPPVDAGARPAPNPVPRAADVRPAAPPPSRTADELYGEAPPEWLDVAGRRVPGNLPAFLDGLVIPRCANAVDRIGTTFGVWTTAELLAVPARAWTFGAPDKLALVSRLREHLARRWGPAGVLGVLAPGEAPEARGAPSPRAPARASFHDRYAAAAAELAADEGEAPDAAPLYPDAIDAPFSEVPS